MATMPLAYHGIAVYKTANHGIEPWLNLNNAASSGDVKKTQGCGGSWFAEPHAFVKYGGDHRIVPLSRRDIWRSRRS
jgi:hypothetical protein